MKIGRLSSVTCFLAGLLLALPAGATQDKGSNPIEKIIGLMTRLQGQLVADEEREQQAYKEYQKYCTDSSFAKKEEIVQAKADKATLTAEISKYASDIKTADGKIEEASGGIAENEAKMKAAKEVRAKEKADFEASEKELMSSIDMIGKAVEILEKELKQGGAALLQSSAATQQLENVVMGLSAVIEGAALAGSEDLQKLTSMLQTRQDSEDGSDDSEGNAQKPYEAKSGSIIEVLEDLRDKAETQLREIRKGEANAIQNYELLTQALQGETSQFTKELDAEKKGKAEAEKNKAEAEGSLAITTKELSKAQEDYSNIQSDCMQKASDHEVSTAGRTQELKTVTQAKKLIQGQMGSLLQTSSDDDQALSFVQMSTKAREQRKKAAGQHVVALVQRLATQQNSNSLKKLASRISAVIKYGFNGKSRDPFGKVKNLLNEMITKLTREQNSDATEKKYCDSEMKKTKANREDLMDETEDLKSKIDQAAAASTKLKSQVKDLQWELGTLEKLVQEMQRARQEGHEAYLTDKADLDKGLNAVRAAIHVLRDYYAADKEESLIQTKTDDTESKSADADSDSDTDEAPSLVQTSSETDDADTEEMDQPEPPEQHEKSQGAGAGIIGMLQVVESDLAKNLAELQTEEDDAQSAFEKELQASKVTKAAKDKDVEFKTKEYTSLDKHVAELSSDHATTSEELAAVEEYFAKVKDRCVAKPEKYEDRKAKREQEIKGLEEAKSILESEGAMFLQKRH